MAAILLVNFQALSLLFSHGRLAALPNRQSGLNMNFGPEDLGDIDFDSVASWDERLAEENAWLAERQLEMDQLETNHIRWMPEQHHHPDEEWMMRPLPDQDGPRSGLWMQDQDRPGGLWMVEHEQDHNRGEPWMAVQQDHPGLPWLPEEHIGAPQKMEVIVPNGCYPGMEFTVAVHNRPLHVTVPHGVVPGMSILVDVP
eukprot:CAMPEP_0174719278 /NCGR_PEP_ID=MMETSP1094-20130205/30885_1 /TAXON_ID=156173 /ORGANISM="Chrysochromulina brevifilum, Strain UTEX LB 985" /LENGTH=198 /DNA_ID=CAMNT_0015919549 /DNA_START=28 /DNA_END=624 /DNA_ORIENTATION=-